MSTLSPHWKTKQGSSLPPPSNPNRDTPIDLDLAEVDQRLRQEMQRLSAVNQELLGGKSRSDDRVQEEIGSLRRENADLRARVSELEQILLVAQNQEDKWAEARRDFESLLEEKSEVIRALHGKVKELQEAGAGSAAAAPQLTVNEQEVLQLQEELEEERRQLKEDEETLMKQMREMEMAMSKERAELARQRNEMQRLQADLNRELEQASRDSGLRERLQAFQRRTQDIGSRKAPSALPASATPNAAPTDTQEPEEKKGSGFFRKLFG